MSIIGRFLSDRKAATAIEYCMVATIISLAIITGAASIGRSVLGFFLSINFGN